MILQIAACVHVMHLEQGGQWLGDGRVHAMRLLGVKDDVIDRQVAAATLGW